MTARRRPPRHRPVPAAPATRPDTRVWHGGWPHLRPGDLLLPPAVTGNARQAAGRERLLTVPGMNADAITPDDLTPDWVHFSPHRRVALAFAATAAKSFGYGALYVVEPDGPVETDPDMPVQGLRAHAARITAVYDPHIRLPYEQAARLHAAVLAAERGRPVAEMLEEMYRVADQAQAALDRARMTYPPAQPYPLPGKASP